MKKILSFLMLMFAAVTLVFAQDPETLASGTFDGKNGTYTEGWSTTGTGVGRNDCVVIGADENITSPEVDLSSYESITVSIKARRYGSLTGKVATIAVTFDGEDIGTVDASTTTATTALDAIDYTVDGLTTGNFVFTCSNATSAGSSHGAGINSIVITGVKSQGGTGTSTKETVYLVNASNWTKPTIHMWGGTANGTSWPGMEMTKTSTQLKGADVYSYTADKGAYANCIFSDNGANQTGDLDWTAGKYYYMNKWYSYDELAGGGEIQVDYYLKNNWDQADAWTWKKTTPVGDGTYKLENVVFGGTGVNWYTEPVENMNMSNYWIPATDFKGDEVAAGNTVTFVFDPKAKTITATLVGGTTPVDPPITIAYDTVYLVNTLGWATPYCYHWGDYTVQPQWPGEAMTKTEGKVGSYDVYMYVAKEGALSKCIFNNGDAENTIQTEDLKPIQDVGKNDKYYVPGNQQDEVGAYIGGTWYATLDAISGNQLAAGFYLIGLKGWTVADLNADLKFAETTTANVYSLTVTLVKDQEFKAVYVNDQGAITNWMPKDGDNFVVTDKYAGEKTVLLNVTGKGGEGWFGGYIYVEPNPEQPEQPTDPTYYLKNNWEAGADWTWKAMTQDGDIYKLENVVFGGTGVNYNTAESDEGAAWVPVDDILGDEIAAKDTVTFVLDPVKATVTATLIGKYQDGGDPVDPETPVDSMTVYFYNNLAWENVNVFVWNNVDGAYKDWSGEAAKKEAEQINGVDVYSYTFPAKYTSVIFNNGAAQTVDLVWDAEKPYFVLNGTPDEYDKYDGKWYAKADIPAPAPEEPVHFFIAGTMTNWKEGMVEMKAGEKDTFTVSIALEADSLYMFKVVRAQGADTAWYGAGMDATMHYGNSTDWSLYGDVDVKLQTTKAADYQFIFVNNEAKNISVVIPAPDPEVTKYYLKNNWEAGADWTWKEMTQDGEIYKLENVVFGGTGVNYNTAESDEGAAWVALEDILGDEIAAKDTVTFVLDPVKATVTATLIGKYQDGGDTPEPPTPGTVYYMKNNWEAGADWTWKAMTQDGDIYKLENVVFGGTGVNYNTAESDEGAAWVAVDDILGDEIAAKDTVTFVLNPDKKTVTATIVGKYAEPVTPPTPSVIYSVAGSKALLGAEWNEKEGNEMTLDTEDGLYKLLCADVTLAAGVTYEFKIVTNHNWNNPNYPDANKVLLVDKDGKYDVTITFNAETKEVAYVAEFKGGVIVEKHYLIVGDAAIANGEDWNNDADVNRMTSADEGLTYTLVISNVKMIANMEYGYKVVEKGSWTEYFPNKGGGNEYFSVTESAVYTLTYTFTVATSQCVVLTSKTGELPEPKLKDGFYLAGSFAGVDAWTIDDLNENKLFKYVEGDENYALYTLTANLAVGDKFKVVSVAQDVIMYWLPDGQGKEKEVTANYAGEAKVINLYFDYKEGRFSIWIEPNIQDGFYLVGSMNNWTPAKEYLFAQNPDNPAEYVLSTTLAENDQFKVVYVYEGEIQNDQWYPAAENSDYKVDALHAGKKDIYFRPDYQGGEDWYYGCIYVAANESTGIEETIAAGKAAKVLRNGQILILKGDKMYNVMGAVIR